MHKHIYNFNNLQFSHYMTVKHQYTRFCVREVAKVHALPIVEIPGRRSSVKGATKI